MGARAPIFNIGHNNLQHYQAPIFNIDDIYDDDEDYYINQQPLNLNLNDIYFNDIELNLNNIIINHINIIIYN
jgi:3-methyladenine DNA glycosylase AlkC